MQYEHNPERIYTRSFDIVKSEARLQGLPEEIANVAIRTMHACGMTDLAEHLAFSAGCVESGRQALEAGAPVLCDSVMTATGVIKDGLPAGNAVLSTINDPEVVERARRLANTRSAAAVDLWVPKLDGAVIAIGNAPTALFRLLELLDEGVGRPALILGFPVGFVGAAESKRELATNPRGVPFLTLLGRRGGSAMAAAAVNALCYGTSSARSGRDAQAGKNPKGRR